MIGVYEESMKSILGEISLEFSNIDVNGTIESKGSSQRGNELGDESIKVGVTGSFHIELSSGDIVDGFVIQHDSNISMFQKGVSRKNGVLGFNDFVDDLRGG